MVQQFKTRCPDHILLFSNFELVQKGITYAYGETYDNGDPNKLHNKRSEQGDTKTWEKVLGVEWWTTAALW